MYKYNVKSDKSKKNDPPSLFEAAAKNDLYMMRVALDAGESLEERRSGDLMTPVHLAAFLGNMQFIRAAIEECPAVVWVFDRKKRRPIEHSQARNDFESADLLLGEMYPH